MKKSVWKKTKRQKELKLINKTKEEILKENSMKDSIKEGSFASVMRGAGDTYITPFALAIGANSFQIGLIKSLTGLLAPFAQLKGSKLMEKYSRKRVIITFVALQALMWFPIIFLAVLFLQGNFLIQLPYLLIILYILYAVFGALASPAWFSLMGDIVPNNTRGRYFSKRSRITSFVTLIITLGAAFVLDYFKTKGIALVGFSIIFSIAGICRLYSAKLFKNHYEPKLKLEKGYYFSFFNFLKTGLKTNFGKFALFVALFYFVSNIAGPFFAVYMLKDLGFSYINYMILTISSTIAGLLFLPFWGKISDKYGNRVTLLISSIIIPFFPFLWLFFKTPYLLIIPQAISGLAWAGFSLSASNFIYDSVSVNRRGLCVAYYNILIGIGIFIGALIGGAVIQYIPITFMNIFLFIFLVSAILRALVVLVFIKKIKEERKVTKATPVLIAKDFARMEGIMQDIGVVKKFFFRKKKST